MKILLTGATGFVGQILVRHLLENSLHTLNLCIRNLPVCEHPRITTNLVSDISGQTEWKEVLTQCEAVIHIAARVHIMHDTENSLELFRAINVDGTLNLARQAAQQNVRRFIFISTVKVNGERTARQAPFQVDDEAFPQCAYAISKYEAEQGLLAIGAATGMEIVIIRPPLIYGPGVKGNFQYMIDSLKKGTPLPLGRLKNKRSFVSVENLVSLITLCIEHPQAANQIFFVSDGQDLSTTELLKKLRCAINKHVLLLPVPAWLLKGMAKLVGKSLEADRLCGSLQVDISKTQALLGWQPVISIDEAFKAMVTHQD